MLDGNRRPLAPDSHEARATCELGELLCSNLTHFIARLALSPYFYFYFQIALLFPNNFYTFSLTKKQNDEYETIK